MEAKISALDGSPIKFILDIELHVPNISTQKFKLMEKGRRLTYTSTPPHLQAPPVKIQTRDL